MSDLSVTADYGRYHDTCESCSVPLGYICLFLFRRRGRLADCRTRSASWGGFSEQNGAVRIHLDTDPLPTL